MATVVKDALPDIDLAPGSTITVTLDTAAGVLSELRVHVWQETDEAEPGLPSALLAHEPS